MQLELVLPLRREGHETGVVRTRADLREDHLVAAHEELHPEQAAPAECRSDACRHVAGARQGRLRHRLRLPRLDVVAVDLPVADRVAEEGLDLAGPAHGPDRELGDLVVEVDEALHDHATGVDPTTRRGVRPGVVDVVGRAHQALALPGRRHDGLDDARESHGVSPGRELLRRVGEAVRRGRQSELLGREPADALTVHRERRGPGRRDHGREAVGLDREQGIGRDGLDLGHHEVRSLGLHHGADGRGVGHVDDVAAVGDLHRRGVGVPVDRDRLDAEPLQRDRDLLAELAGSEEEDARRVRAERGADGHGAIMVP